MGPCMTSVVPCTATMVRMSSCRNHSSARSATGIAVTRKTSIISRFPSDRRRRPSPASSMRSPSARDWMRGGCAEYAASRIDVTRLVNAQNAFQRAASSPDTVASAATVRPASGYVPTIGASGSTRTSPALAGMTRRPCAARSSSRSNAAGIQSTPSRQALARNPGWNSSVAPDPPIASRRSRTSTRLRFFASNAAWASPLAPAPMTIASYRLMRRFPGSRGRRAGRALP